MNLFDDGERLGRWTGDDRIELPEGWAHPGPYRTIIADPPWLYSNAKNTSTGIGLDGLPTYSTMPDDDICALAPAVQALAAPDSVMIMWATWPKLDVAMRVMEAWGFKHKTGLAWVKLTKDGRPRGGVGFWFRGCTEPVLIGTRGKGPFILTRPDGVTKAGRPKAGRTNTLGIIETVRGGGIIETVRGGHSQKPEDMHRYAEKHLPGPYCEIFARRPVDGWRTIGHDVGSVITSEGVSSYECPGTV